MCFISLTFSIFHYLPPSHWTAKGWSQIVLFSWGDLFPWATCMLNNFPLTYDSIAKSTTLPLEWKFFYQVFTRHHQEPNAHNYSCKPCASLVYTTMDNNRSRTSWESTIKKLCSTLVLPNPRIWYLTWSLCGVHERSVGKAHSGNGLGVQGAARPGPKIL